MTNPRQIKLDPSIDDLTTTTLTPCINDLITENQDLRIQNEALRDEALAWHKRAADQANQVTLVMSLETFQRLYDQLRRAGVNPCVSPED